jgi:hypothetical protein
MNRGNMSNLVNVTEDWGLRRERADRKQLGEFCLNEKLKILFSFTIVI